jgi:hypothetical protein
MQHTQIELITFDIALKINYPESKDISDMQKDYEETDNVFPKKRRR